MANKKEYEMLFKLNAQLGGNYNSTFKSAQSSISSMQTELQTFNKLQSDISSYQKQQTAMDATKKRLTLLQDQYGKIQKEISETGTYSSTLENKLLSKQQQIDKTSASLEQQTQKLGMMGTALQDAGISTNHLGQESAKLGTQIDELKQKQEAAADEANTFGNNAVTAVTAVQQALVAAGIGVALKKVYDLFMDCADASVAFETAMTGVEKTTDFSAEGLQEMSENLKDMSLVIPETTTELGAIAETAGQLGIAKEDLGSFTEIMAMLGTATNMTSEEAATMLAQFASITGMNPDYYSNLGATIVDLGNNFATTERNISDMSQRIAAAGSIAGMSEADILAVSAAVSSLGISAENGGTQMSKLVSDINSAASSGEGIEDWAEATHMSAAEFSTAWGEDAAGALDLFIHGLNETYESGGDVYSVLSDLGITETRMVTAVTSLAKSGTRLTDTLGVANKAWTENNALTTEAEKRYATTASQQKLAQNAFETLKVAVGDNYTPALRLLYAAESEVFTWTAELIEQSPALVRAVTTFATVWGTATVALTGYVAIRKTLETIKLIPSLAKVSPIMLGITAVAGLTAGIVALATAAAEDAAPSVRELTDAARGMSEAIEINATAYEDTVTSTMAAANVADIYIGKLEELEAAGLKTDQETKQYHSTLALLCQAVPELAGHIDLEKNMIDGGTEALRANTEAWKDNALQQALQTQNKALYDDYSAVLIEAEKNSIGLTKAQYALDHANKVHSESLARMKVLWAEASEKAKQSKESNGKAKDAAYFLTAEYAELAKAVNSSGVQAMTAQQAMESYSKAVEEDQAVATNAKEAIDAQEEATRSLASATGESSATTAEAAQQEKELKEAIGYTTAQVAALVESYDKAYAAALESVQGQYQLWDSVSVPIATSAETINSALGSQITYWQDYNANLQALTERGAEIEGLSAVISSFADGSEDSVKAIAGMAGASDADLRIMIQKWKDLQAEQGKAAGSIADTQTDFTNSMNAMKQGLVTTIGEMNLGAEAAESGKKTIEGFTRGATNMLPTVRTAYARIAQAAKDALSYQTSVVPPPLKGYASGTQYAEPGVALVGEQGPELVYFNGGEQVMTASETAAMGGGISELQTVAFAPELMEMLHSFGADRETKAEKIKDASLQYEKQRERGSFARNSNALPPINITFKIEGNASEATVEALRIYGNEFAEAVLQVVENAATDVVRKSYT